MDTFVIASRGSKLALYQAEFVQKSLGERFPQHRWEIQTFTTTGDRFLDKPLSSFGGKGAFLKEIEEAMLSGKAHLAVHSLKDVPADETPGLQLTAFLEREDPRDVWVSEKEEIGHLPAGSVVGTSSLRRSILVRFYRPDLKVELLRGNLDTRLRKLREKQYDAIIVAAAGLHRLQLFDDRLMHYLSEEAFIPAIGQGIMVVQTRKDLPELASLVAQLDHADSRTAAQTERRFLGYFHGGCHLPVGGFATRKPDNSWRFRGFVGGVRSGRIVQDSAEGQDPMACAEQLHRVLESRGAADLLAELEE